MPAAGGNFLAFWSVFVSKNTFLSAFWMCFRPKNTLKSSKFSACGGRLSTLPPYQLISLKITPPLVWDWEITWGGGYFQKKNRPPSAAENEPEKSRKIANTHWKIFGRLRRPKREITRGGILKEISWCVHKGFTKLRQFEVQMCGFKRKKTFFCLVFCWWLSGQSQHARSKG